MSQKYKEKKPTGREYVDKTREFCNVTHRRCDMLPKRWSETLLYPMIRCADEIETDVILANKVYINTDHMYADELIDAYKQRIDYLTHAVGLFSDFDIKFERLMGMIDIAGSEKQRLKNILKQVIKEEKAQNPDVKDMEITLRARSDEMEYISESGTHCMKLKLTAKNRDYWLDTEAQALAYIRGRISNDKKAISRLQKSVS